MHYYLGFALFSGARVGEILALEEADIDFENKKVFISKSKHRTKGTIGTTKTNKIAIDVLPIAKQA